MLGRKDGKEEGRMGNHRRERRVGGRKKTGRLRKELRKERRKAARWKVEDR